MLFKLFYFGPVALATTFYGTYYHTTAIGWYSRYYHRYRIEIYIAAVNNVTVFKGSYKYVFEQKATLNLLFKYTGHSAGKRGMTSNER